MPVISTGLTLVTERPSCLTAAFHPPGDNPFCPFAASDDRGTLHGLDLGAARPHLVEVIHSAPGAIRGNHVHRHCTEIFTVVAGTLRMYLLCGCPDRHLWETTMTPGSTLVIPPGTPHALYTDTPNDSIATFADGDPRTDRDRVRLLEFDL